MKQLKPLTLRRNFSWTFIGNVVYTACQWGMLVVLAKLGSSEMRGLTTTTSTSAAHTGEIVKFRVGIQGVNANQAADIMLTKDLGVGYIRFDVRWEEVEKQKGAMDLSIYDQHFTNLSSSGIRALASLNFNNPSYGAASIFSPFTSEQIQGFSTFAFAMANHHQGKDVIWEIYNEPNQPGFWPNPDPIKYMELAASTSSAIRAANPRAKVFGPAVGLIPVAKRPQPWPWANEYLDFVYLKSCLNSGLLSHVDAVSVHPYPGSYPEPIVETYTLLRSLLGSYPGGRKIPLVVSETGYNTQGEWKVTEQEQAMWLPRQILINLSQDIPLTIIWSLRDMAVIQNNPNEFFGLTRPDGSEKPAYKAVKALLSNLGDLHFDKRISAGKGNWVLRFTNGKRTVIAAWTTAASHSINVEGQTISIMATPIYVQVATPTTTSSRPP
jgi:polysaccharide biosynthesis protein PslG